ncbi:Rossmann fold nucleotide-binding protein Smf possibly involved in DNA uptake [plant metagenome]|uniref:Rossmann fold nucleotide-binding protein Smf possibly involved in DNA uptake n=1 Tax=plant metagenome TaxID=1297885 RepID=A0A484R2U1_9ZZZZ
MDASPATSPSHPSHWLRLSLEPGVGPVTALGLLRAFGSPGAIHDAPYAALARMSSPALAEQLKAPPSGPVRDGIAQGLAWQAAHPTHHLLTLDDAAYPAMLRTLPDPPLVLYARGQVARLQEDGLAIVGARNATPAGLANAQAFARHLAGAGWCIVSGLARGIDAAAHAGALEAGASGGGTVALLGTGIDQCYPRAHRKLAEAIAAQGVLLSELPVGTDALPHHFPRRNRLVAGLARGVLVVEAARQSGSLGTARLAAEGGREVFAVPGSIHSPLSRGCHALIRQGAKLVELAQDITEELGPPKGGRGRLAGHANENRPPGQAPSSGPVHPLLTAMGHDPVHPDTLALRTGRSAASLHADLLALELEGAVLRLPGGRFQRC